MKLIKFFLFFIFTTFCFSQTTYYSDILKELRSNRLEKALALCDNKIKDKPDDALAYAYKSYCYLVLSQKNTVELDYEALRLRGIKKGQTYLFKEGESMRDFLIVRVSYKKDTLELAEKSILKSLEYQKGNIEYLFSLATIYQAQENHQKLLDLIDSLFNKYPKENFVNPVNRFALTYYNKKKYNEALDIYSRLRKQYPDYSPAYSDAGTIFLLKGEVDSSLKYLEEAYRITPLDSLTNANLAQVYMYMQRFDAASFYKENVYGLDTTNLISISDLGFLYLTKDKEKSIWMFNKFLSSAKNNYGTLQEIIREILSDMESGKKDLLSDFNKIEKLVSNGFPNYALIFLTNIIKNDPLNNVAYFELGIIYRDLNLPQKALEILTKCEKLTQELSFTREVLAIIYTEKAKSYLLLNDYDNVLKFAKLSFDKFGKKSSENYYYLGLAYLHFDKKDIAKSYFNNVIKINDNKKLIEQTKYELDRLAKK